MVKLSVNKSCKTPQSKVFGGSMCTLFTSSAEEVSREMVSILLGDRLFITAITDYLKFTGLK